jgi:hypothetical protein
MKKGSWRNKRWEDITMRSSSVVFSARYCYSHYVKGDEMDRASSTNGGGKQYKVLVRKPQGRRPFRRSRRRWDYNIKYRHRVKRSVGWIQLAQDRVQRLTFAHTIQSIPWPTERLWSKIRVNLSLGIINQAPREDLWERKCSFTILNFHTRWRWVVSFMPLPLYLPGHAATDNHWLGGRLGPRANLDVMENKNISCPYRKSNPDSSVIQPLS